MALEQELATFERLHDQLAVEEGKFALIGGEELLGTYDSQSDALREGYRRRGLDHPFLVKRIQAFEVVAYISRELQQPCIVV